jgi:long-chain acyl-CoA synthetase
MDLGNLLSSSASRVPKRIAVIFETESISYEQLDRASSSHATWFLEQGFRPGDRVALLWPNSLEMVKLLFACFKAGLIAVPINVSMKVPEIAYVLGHSKAVTCMVHPNLVREARQASRDCASLCSVHSGLEPVEHKPHPDFISVQEDDPTLLLYTCGTTARPKGVTHTHKTIQEIIRPSVTVVREAGEVVLLITQLTYIAALCGSLLPAIASGATTVVAPGSDAPLVLDLIERFQCGYMIALPSMVQFLVEEQRARPRNVRSLRTALVGGDSLPLITQERFRSLFGIAAREAYGMTEIGILTANPEGEIRSGSLGRAVAGVEIRVVDNEGREMPDGQTGEIIARSPGCFVGYWEDPQATAETIRQGWLYTGDLGRRDDDGFLCFDGRKKEIIVRYGSNISPQEVEAAISAHPAVLEAAVVGQAVPVCGERVVAYVRLREGQRADEQELREFAAERLADNKVPERIEFLPVLPKGMTGKVQRRALKEMAATTAPHRVPEVPAV